MADVGDEVAAGGLHPGVLGLVVDVDHRETAVVLAQQPHVATDEKPGATGVLAPHGGEVEVDVLAGGQRALRGGPCPVVEQPVADQAQFARLVVHVDDVTVGVDDHGAHRRQRHDVLQHLRDGDAVLVDGPALPALGDPRGQRQPDADAERQREEGNDCHRQQRRYHTHAKIVRTR